MGQRRLTPESSFCSLLQLGVEAPSVTQLAEHLLMLSTLASATDKPHQAATGTSADGDAALSRDLFRRSATPTPIDGEDLPSPDPSLSNLCRTPEQGSETISPVCRLKVSSLPSGTATTAKSGPSFSSLALALPSYSAAAALYASLAMHVGHAPGLLGLVAGAAQCDPGYILSLAQVRKGTANILFLHTGIIARVEPLAPLSGVSSALLQALIPLRPPPRRCRAACCAP